MWLQDKFVPENVIKKHTDPRTTRRNNRPANRQARSQAVGRYFQNMGNKMSNLNPLKKVRLKGRIMNGPMVIFRKDSEELDGAHDSDYEVDKDDDDSSDIVSTSSSATSYDALSIEDCLDIIGGNVAGDPELFINIPRIGRDEEVMLTSCGALATTMERNKRILMRRHINKRTRHRSGPYEESHMDDFVGRGVGDVSPMLLSSNHEDSSAEEKKDSDDVFDKPIQAKAAESQTDENIPATEPLPDILPETEAGLPEDEHTPNDNDEQISQNQEEQNANIQNGRPSDEQDKGEASVNSVAPEEDDQSSKLPSSQVLENATRLVPVDSSTPAANQQKHRKRRSRKSGPELHVSIPKDDLGEMEVTENPLPEFLNNEFELCDLAPSPRSPISKSPQKSRSDNSLADYLRNDKLNRRDSADSGDLMGGGSQSSQDSNVPKRFKNPFRNLNLNVNFNRGEQLRASLLKAKQQLEKEMNKSNTRFIQV